MSSQPNSPESFDWQALNSSGEEAETHGAQADAGGSGSSGPAYRRARGADSPADDLLCGILFIAGCAAVIGVVLLLVWYSSGKDRSKRIAKSVAVLQEVPTDRYNFNRRVEAIDFLGECGADAKEAIPVLVAIRDREDWSEARSAYVSKFVNEAVKNKPSVYVNGSPPPDEIGNLREQMTKIAHAHVDSYLREEREHAAAALAKIK